MRITQLLFCLIIALGIGNACHAVVVKPASEIVMMIADLQCDEVWEGVLEVLKNNKTPLLVIDKKGGYIETGPIITFPLNGDSFQKMEEQYRIEIKCIKTLITQITCQIKLRGLTADNEWVQIEESLRYEKRFLDSLKLNK
jgi:hypothetical protein